MAKIVIVGNPTATSVIQATLDSLTPEEKAMYLQHEILFQVDRTGSIPDDFIRGLEAEVQAIILDEAHYIKHPAPIKLLDEDDLPSNTTKPKFLMQRDHHIRKVRK